MACRRYYNSQNACVQETNDVSDQRKGSVHTGKEGEVEKQVQQYHKGWIHN